MKFEEKKIEPALKNKIRFFAGLKPGEEQKLKPKKTKKQKPKRKKIEQISEIASSLKQTFLHNVFGAHFRRMRTPQSPCILSYWIVLSFFKIGTRQKLLMEGLAALQQKNA